MKKLILIALLLPFTASAFCWGVYGTDKEHCDSGHFNYERDCSKLDNSRRYWVKNWGHEWELGACPTQTFQDYKDDEIISEKHEQLEQEKQKEILIEMITVLEELIATLNKLIEMKMSTL